MHLEHSQYSPSPATCPEGGVLTKDEFLVIKSHDSIQTIYRQYTDNIQVYRQYTDNIFIMS